MRPIALCSCPLFFVASASAYAPPAALFGDNLCLVGKRAVVAGEPGHLDGWEAAATAGLGVGGLFVHACAEIGGENGYGADEARLGWRRPRALLGADLALTVAAHQTFGVAVRRELSPGLSWSADFTGFGGGSDHAFGLAFALGERRHLDVAWRRVSWDDGAKTTVWYLGLRREY